MIKLDMEDPVICGNCIFCRENPNTGASECILKLPNHYEVDIHSKDKNCPIIAEEEGEWILDDKANLAFIYKCSKCDRRVSVYTDSELTNMYPFCHCGAKMKVGVK